MSSKYTDAEKLAYYKAKAARPRAAKRPKARKASNGRRSVRPTVSRVATAPAAIGQEVGNVGLNISSSTQAYMHGIVNPSDAPACGMPIGGVPTEKNKCWARGRMSTGTAGVGYIVGLPTGIMENDANCAYVTGTAFAGTAISTTPAANSVIEVKGNSPYSFASFGAQKLKGRFVCGEIRVRYIGTELNRGGDAVVYCDTNHQSLVGYTESNLLSFAAAGRSFISMNEWISCKYNGVVDPSEENFVINPLDSTQTKNANACMVVWINSAVAAQPFDYEVWGHFEIIGSLGANLTTLPPDTTGHTATNSGAQSAQIEHPGSHDEHAYGGTFATKVFHTIATGVSKVGDILSDKGTQTMIKNAVTKVAPVILKGMTKAAPLMIL